MPRYIRNSAIASKAEASYGTDAAPAGVDVVAVGGIQLTINTKNVERDIYSRYLGNPEQLVGAAWFGLEYDIELAGSGAAGTAPAWRDQLLMSGFAETVTAGSRVEYTLVSSGFGSSTLVYEDDGVLHKLLGARGNAEFRLPAADKPVIHMSVLGLYGGVTAAAIAGADYTDYKKPVVVKAGNTVGLNIGCTYAAGALAGGTVYTGQGLSINTGFQPAYLDLVPTEEIDLGNRTPSCDFALDLSAAQQVAFMAEVMANTETSLGFTHGVAAGSKFIFHAPYMQKLNPKKVELNGRRLEGYTGNLNKGSGNQDFRLVCL